ncbi:MAG: Hsp20/alpha crystallin family protein [Candidatus Moranbacteria bacterium]|nr:Hsp20/alpha crystallin family protein [Candidatus Moranbacteria bacterium]
MKKKSFLERLTGKMDEDEEIFDDEEERSPSKKSSPDKEVAINARGTGWDEELEAELTVDLYQTPSDIIVKTMVAGVQPENLSITITRDMITIKGKREEGAGIDGDNYFVRELYWGAFSRTISLPEEVDPEEAEAIEKHGLLIIKLPKLDKHRETKLKIKSM